MHVLCLLCVVIVGFNQVTSIKYQPNWNSLDSRPIPNWYDGLKVGILVRWGVYSVPSYGSDKFWYKWKHDKDPYYVDFMQRNYPPGFTYGDFAPKLTAELFDPDYWAELFDASGAGYVIVSAKDSEGFSMYPSKYSFNWNSMDMGPQRDLVGELETAVRNKTFMFFGVYYALNEEMNPLYIHDMATNFTSNNFVQMKVFPQLQEIVNAYRPDIVWSNDDGTAPDTYWNSTQFLAWLYNDSPVNQSVLTNDRWGRGTACHHGGVFTCQDRYNPGNIPVKKWENVTSIDRKAWTNRREAHLEDFLSMNELIATVAKTVSYGGNILISVGPAADGTIPTIYEERLRQLGAWLHLNGQGIYGTKPWKFQYDSQAKGVWYTSIKISMVTAVYAIVLEWPETPQLFLKEPITVPNFTTVNMYGYDKPLNWTAGEDGGISINVSEIPQRNITYPWGWVFQMWSLKNA